MAVLLALLWLWSNVLFAAWCVNANGHEFNTQPDRGALQAGARPGHHAAVCQGTSGNAHGAVSRSLSERDRDSGSADLITAAQAPLPLSPGATKAAPPRFHEVFAFTSPPLYLLFQKLLLPFTV